MIKKNFFVVIFILVWLIIKVLGHYDDASPYNTMIHYGTLRKSSGNIDGSVII